STEAGHHAAADETGRFGTRCGVDLHRLARGDEGQLGEGADAEGGAQWSAIRTRHLLRRVATVEAVPGSTAPARSTVAARRPPGDHDVVTRRDAGDTVADRLDRAGGLVTEEEGEVVVDGALPVVEVGVAHTARLDPDEHLVGPGIGDDDRLERDRPAPVRGDDALHLMSHGCGL